MIHAITRLVLSLSAVVVLLSSVVGAAIGLLLIVFKGRDHSVPLAFGPYLAIAGAIALFFGPTLVKMYLR